MGATTTPLTFEEFERLPDEPAKLELMDGELVRMPPPESRHMRIAHRLQAILAAALEKLHGEGKATDLGDAFVEMGYRIGPNWLIPDVSITYAGQTENEYLEGAPALAVEVISKSNSAETMQRKVKEYVGNGAREVWFVYPRTRSVSVYRGKTAVEMENTLTTGLLPELSIDLSKVFGDAV